MIKDNLRRDCHLRMKWKVKIKKRPKIMESIKKVYRIVATSASPRTVNSYTNSESSIICKTGMSTKWRSIMRKHLYFERMRRVSPPSNPNSTANASTNLCPRQCFHNRIIIIPIKVRFFDKINGKSGLWMISNIYDIHSSMIFS